VRLGISGTVSLALGTSELMLEERGPIQSKRDSSRAESAGTDGHRIAVPGLASSAWFRLERREVSCGLDSGRRPKTRCRLAAHFLFGRAERLEGVLEEIAIATNVDLLLGGLSRERRDT
jgi:hypothetical protein